MSEIINLRARRKAAERAAARAAANENSARHGRTKAEKRRDAAQAEKADRHLEGHLRDLDRPAPDHVHVHLKDQD